MMQQRSSAASRRWIPLLVARTHNASIDLSSSVLSKKKKNKEDKVSIHDVCKILDLYPSNPQKPKIISEENKNQPGTINPASQSKIPVTINPASQICSILNTNKWSSHTESQITPYLPTLNSDLVLQVLNGTQETLQAYYFFQWTLSHNIKQNMRTYANITYRLGRERLVALAKALVMDMEFHGVKWEAHVFNYLMSNYARMGSFPPAYGIFTKMSELGVRRNVASYDILFTFLLRRGLTQKAREHYRVMVEEEGIEPTIKTYNVLIKGFMMCGEVLESLTLFKDMRERNFKPDVISYSCLLDGLCRNGRIDIALRIWKEMRTNSQSVAPNVYTYTIMISGLCKDGRVDEAFELLKKMISLGVDPSHVTYNTIINSLCKFGRFDEASEFIQEMGRANNFKPDSYTLRIMIRSLCRVGKIERAMEIFESMGKQANSTTYGTMIKGLLSGGQPDKAVELVEDLIEKKVLFRAMKYQIPVVSFYDRIISHLYECGKASVADTLFRQLLYKGVQNPETFNTVIIGNCLNGRAKSGAEIIRFMILRGYIPDMKTFHAVILSCMMEGLVTEAMVIFRKIFSCGWVPYAATYHVVIGGLFKNGRLREASDVMKDMLEKDVRQNITVSTRILRALFLQGFEQEALERLELLHDKGFVPNFSKLLESLFKHGRFSEAQRVLLLMAKKSYFVNIMYYNIVFTGLCNGTGEMVMDAFSLFYEMTFKEKVPYPSCCRLLVSKLKERGKTKEAEFVIRRLKSIDDKMT